MKFKKPEWIYCPAPPMKIKQNKEIIIGSTDEETGWVMRCACGVKFSPWEQIISVYKDAPWICPECKRRFFIRIEVYGYELKEQSDET